MDFRQLEYFQAVVEAGSVSAAAKRLGMTQPSISTAVAKLERELGVLLLERAANGVRPTNAGLYLLSEGTRMLLERGRVARTLAMMGEGIVGQLRIGAEPMVINEFMAEALSVFMDDAPDVHVSLTDAAPEQVLGSLRRGELDVGCLPFGIDQLTDAVTQSCDVLQIGELEMKLAIPMHRLREDHPDGHGWGRWIMPRPLPSFRGYPDAVERELAGRDPHYDTIEVSTPQTAVGFVAAGLGVAIVTSRMVERHPAIALLEPPAWVPALGVCLLWRRGAEVTPVMQRWASACQSVLSATA